MQLCGRFPLSRCSWEIVNRHCVIVRRIQIGQISVKFAWLDTLLTVEASLDFRLLNIMFLILNHFWINYWIIFKKKFRNKLKNISEKISKNSFWKTFGEKKSKKLQKIKIISEQNCKQKNFKIISEKKFKKEIKKLKVVLFLGPHKASATHR